MKRQPPGWLEGRPDNEDFNYDQLHRDVGDISQKVLAALSLDLDTLEANRHGWTVSEVDCVRWLHDIDVLSGTMVPPEATPLEHRQRANDHLRDLHTALPYSESERFWLLGTALQEALYASSRAAPHDEDYLEPVKAQQAELISDGVRRAINGRDLLQRFWSWRREVGEYTEGEGLNQARQALAGLVELLTPDLGLPAEYELLITEASGDT